MIGLQFSSHRRAAVRALAVALAALGGTASSAVADPPGPAYWLYEGMATTPLERGQFYVGFTLNAGVQQLPRWNSTISLFTSFAAGTPSFGPGPFDENLLGVQPGGEIGHVFRDGTFPAWAGSRVRAALYGSYFFARNTSGQSTSVPPGSFAGQQQGVNGTQTLNFGAAGFTSYDESLTIHREAFQIGLKLESDIALGPNLSLTPAVAVFGGRTHDNYEYAGALRSIATPGFKIFPSAINERLRTSEVGGHVGARLTWQVIPGWALHLGGTAGPVWLRPRLSASDCLNGTAVTAGTPCGPSNTLFVTTSAADSRSTVAFRGTASLGIAADLRYAVVSLGGFMRYDSRIPGIENPQLSALTVGATLVPARIRFEDGFAYGGFLTVRVPVPF